MRWAFAFCVMFWLAAGCGGAASPPPATKPTPPDFAKPGPATGFQFTITPANSEVIVNGEVIGLASELEDAIEYPSGIHQIMVRNTGYQTWRAEVAIRDRVEVIEVRLEPSNELSVGG